MFSLQQKLFWVPYERYEYTRLSQIRAEMDEHRSYRKETILGDDDGADNTEEGAEFSNNNTPSGADSSTAQGEKKDQGSFIWTFLIRPVH